MFSKEYKDKECCDLSCYLLIKIKQTNGNWSKALTEIKDFLKEYQPNGSSQFSKPIPGGMSSFPLMPNNSSSYIYLDL